MAFRTWMSSNGGIARLIDRYHTASEGLMKSWSSSCGSVWYFCTCSGGATPSNCMSSSPESTLLA